MLCDRYKTVTNDAECEDVSEIAYWEVEADLKKMKNWKAASNKQGNIERLEEWECNRSDTRKAVHQVQLQSSKEPWKN